ncbi:MAG: hypothetical protein LBE92_19310 [Chryseobacterium sp.]|jgi:hypothetical protein|uniref:hypothetical protein n=1 Tax=Chryseobacterium sp. TaxID=1871047 RepID=UPI0028351D56|nr:hypothetical protein [Chryseobacterium sp.]MDR2238279.1 hypothetical protein [Chryseobacterium sp.]
MNLLKKILWYNMFDLEVRGKDLPLARKGTSMILAGTALLFIIDYTLWNLESLSGSLSDDAFEAMSIFGRRGRFLGSILGLLSIGLFYLCVFVMMGRKCFFEQTLQEYEAMSLGQKTQAAQKGKFLIIIPFVLALLLLFYIILFRLD